MATTALPPMDDSSALHEETVEFPDNFLLIDLCGEHDRNLAEIERQLGVQIMRRGNQLSVVGEEPLVKEGVGVLTALYARLEAGRPVEAADIDRELRMGGGRPEPQTESCDGDQLEMFKGGPVEIKTRKKLVEPRTDAQKAYVLSLFNNEMAFGIGPAGTGKTYLAVAVGVSMFIEGHVDRIILARPAVEAGEKLGFLPGDLEAKVHPYLRPLLDALHDMLEFETIRRFMETDVLEIAPLAYMRGRTLNHSVIILDEAQNTTAAQMKMFLTRLGHGSKMIVTGDTSQIDLSNPAHSGLIDAARRFKDVPGAAFIRLQNSDVVRHPLVQRIIEAYQVDGPHH